MSIARSTRKVAALVVALSLACTGVVVIVTQQTASAATCTPILFIGVRGSGEPAGLGTTIQDTYNNFVASETQSTSLYVLPYAASPVPVINRGASVSAFINSVNAGKVMLVNYLNTQVAQCPTQKIVVAGYSQGGLVVVEAMRTLSVATMNHVAGIALLGEPAFDPQFAGNVGTYSKNDSGIVSTFTSIYKSQSYLPATVSGKSKSYCLAYDPVCNYSIVSLTNCLWSGANCTHNLYVQKGYTRQAGQFLASKV
jgi:hypothetical protein